MILHHISNFATRGGAEMMLARVLNALPEEEFVVVSLTGVSDDLKGLLTAGNVECIALGATGPLSMGRAARELAAILRDRRPEAVMAWMYHANLVASVAAKRARYDGPLVWNIRQSLDAPKALSRSARLALAGNRLMARSPDAIVYAGARAQQMHEAYGLRNAHPIVMPNGYTLPPFTGPRAGPPKVIGAAARLHPQKDFPGLLRAAATVLNTHPDVRLRLAGAGVEAANPVFNAMLDASGIARDRVEALGQVAHMATFYDSIDIFALGSLTEGFPNVLAEAMAHGVPCVSTDVGDAARIVQGSGLTVPPGQPAALANALDQMLTAPDYTDRSAHARATIETHYRIENIAAHYLSLLRDPKGFTPPWASHGE